MAMTNVNLSARTIADLASAGRISAENIFEAIQYRSMDCQILG